jgi:hypothetical protein
VDPGFYTTQWDVDALHLISNKVTPLHADEGGEALERWDQQLIACLQRLEAVAALRGPVAGRAPLARTRQPDARLSRRSGSETVDGARAGLIWLAVHNGFEGALAERAVLLDDVRRG